MGFQKIFSVLVIFSSLLFFGACASSPTATPTSALETSESPTIEPTETSEPVTLTLTPLSVTSTREPPTATPEPPTATPLPPIATAKIIVNVRAGPSASYPLYGKLKKGEKRPITGKSEDSKWWQIQFEDKAGWIPADFTEVEGGTNAVTLVSAVPLTTPTLNATRVITPGSTGTPAPAATPTLQVPPPSGRIYFVIQQHAAWLRPGKKEQIFSDVTINMPGDFSPNLSTNASPLDWSATVGKLTYILGGNAQDKLQTVDRNSNVFTLDSHGAISTPRWLGSGQQIAYIGYDNNFQNQKIYLINSDGSKPGNYVCFAARSGESLRGLAVSKKTGDIAFVSNFSGRFEIWKLDRFCNNPVKLTNDNADDSAPAFSPDGTKIAYVSNKTAPTDHEIYLMSSTGANPTRLERGFTPAFSPDGFWLTFSHNGEVYIMDVSGSNIQTLAPGEYPTWAE